MCQHRFQPCLKVGDSSPLTHPVNSNPRPIQCYNTIELMSCCRLSPQSAMRKFSPCNPVLQFSQKLKPMLEHFSSICIRWPRKNENLNSPNWVINNNLSNPIQPN